MELIKCCVGGGSGGGDDDRQSVMAKRMNKERERESEKIVNKKLFLPSGNRA